jgi:Probable cobalt transporter subunit (CbtB)
MRTRNPWRCHVFQSLTQTAPVDLPLPAPIPLRDLAPWLLFGGLIMMLAVYFVGVEQGALSVFAGSWVHEFVHDGRHLLAFPCH